MFRLTACLVLAIGCAAEHGGDEDVLSACSRITEMCGGQMAQCEAAFGKDLETGAGGVTRESLRCVAAMSADKACVNLNECLPGL